MWHGCLKDVAGEEIRVSMEIEDDSMKKESPYFLDSGQLLLLPMLLSAIQQEGLWEV